ncbi:hypothetical protein [Sorangium atrum]|uniref:Uncharacterized protein n=1 Tax=Sorangium atrum TaxID=2995308 RepID=A0ABT5BZU3_9BACT|nr:hypothetical protein [Sorangium aterium]MDC0679684.1 hypothetical protein [Sorangium aterium]
MTDRAEKRRVLTEEDLSYVVEQLAIFDAHAGVHPYNRAELWGSVMELYLTAKTRADREAFAELVGALRVIDVLDRHFLRREPKGTR